MEERVVAFVGHYSEVCDCVWCLSHLMAVNDHVRYFTFVKWLTCVV